MPDQSEPSIAYSVRELVGNLDHKIDDLGERVDKKMDAVSIQVSILQASVMKYQTEQVTRAEVGEQLRSARRFMASTAIAMAGLAFAAIRLVQG